MSKADVIRKMCLELLSSPEIPSSEVLNHLSISAGLIESDITKEGCDDWFDKSMSETASYISEKVRLCSNTTLDDVYLLLLKMPGTMQH